MKIHTDAGDAHGGQEASCLSDEAIEEAAVQRTAQRPVSMDIERHLSACLHCSDRFNVARDEAQSLHGVFSLGIPQAAGACLSDEEIALYLDQALDASRRVAAVRHLARCMACQRRMASLYDEVQAVCAENSENTALPSVSLAEVRDRLAASKAERGDSEADDGVVVPSEEQVDIPLKREARQR